MKVFRGLWSPWTLLRVCCYYDCMLQSRSGLSAEGKLYVKRVEATCAPFFFDSYEAGKNVALMRCLRYSWVKWGFRWQGGQFARIIAAFALRRRECIVAGRSSSKSCTCYGSGNFFAPVDSLLGFVLWGQRCATRSNMGCQASGWLRESGVSVAGRK